MYIGEEKVIPFTFKGKKRNRYFVCTKCAGCGKLTWTFKSNIKKGKFFVCSQTCKNSQMIGPKNPAFTGGRKFKDGKKKQGHVLLYKPNHPLNYKNYVPEHRIVVEKHIKRFLKKEEVVHHINCVKDDNRLKNLFVCSSNSHHNLVHGSINKIIKPLLERGYIRFNSKKSIYEII